VDCFSFIIRCYELNGVKFVPSVTVEVTDQAIAEKVMKMLDMFEAHDDVQNVNSNFELSPDLDMG
ncbi:MAG TPA: hypothetical protein PLG41_17980, partial [Leptospiraceae bacterium]|nr:hypothetical protein [Leptospiraceae bacterium]